VWVSVAAEPGIRAVIFDLDGTLVDSAGEIALALASTFRSMGVEPLSLEQVERLIGKGVRTLVQRALMLRDAKGIDLDVAVSRMESFYEEVVGREAKLYDGVREGLERLRQAGVPMALVTNKPRYFTLELMGRLAMREFFKVVVAGDDGLAAKPRGDMLVHAAHELGLEPGDALMIGDSANDAAAARDAGCPVWCVRYGYTEGLPPESLACDRLVDDIDEAARRIAQGDI
jgi:phosphoglycolate phosphatase